MYKPFFFVKEKTFAKKETESRNPLRKEKRFREK